MTKGFIAVALICLTLLAALGFVPANGLAAKDNARMIELSALQVRACSVAFANFVKNGYDLNRFVVSVEAHGSKYEVRFVPEHPKDSPAVRGGGTAYGKEVSYLISEQGTIEKVTYAR